MKGVSKAERGRKIYCLETWGRTLHLSSSSTQDTLLGTGRDLDSKLRI
jgi:hypothetical protein